MEITITIKADASGAIEVQQATAEAQPTTLRPMALEMAQPAALLDVGPMSKLTYREIEVLRLAAAGLSYQEIADTLVLSERTIRTHMFSITNKLGVSSGHMAALWGLFAGVITAGEILDVWRTHRAHLVVGN